MSCTGHLHRARSILTAADSMRLCGTAYSDSSQLAEAYATLHARRLLYPSDYAQACYHYGRLLREAGHPVDAMRCFIEGTESGTDDHLLLARTYSNMANMCRQAEKHAAAFAIYRHSAEQFLLGEDTLYYAYALNNMAWEQAVLGHKKQALALIDSATSICPDEAIRSKVTETYAAAALYTGQYDSVLHYTQLLPDGSLYRLMLRAQAFALQEECDSALKYAEEVSEMTDNPRYLDDAYYILAHCDSSAGRSEVLDITSARTDVQRNIESYKSEMAQACVLIEQHQTKSYLPYRLIGIIVLLVVCGLIWLLYSHSRAPEEKAAAPSTTEQRKRALRQLSSDIRRSEQPKKALPLDDFPGLCTYGRTHLFGLPDALLRQGLSEREVRIAVLVLLGFSYAEMADMLNRAENGIGKDKYVIARKLGVSVRELQAKLTTIACNE